ncbi:GyrI-like domain-containing protein [Brevibacterium spongiae]|uniref:GyrI-like domain-containing protein n=1 Tax=Brevibacterium spongiae TaxID=2909672 RepID=A0ABY5SMQ1_9MICO|nr:GyrI-like domain-containing protein [Brevibacterium spongiae]UVI35847.1 GyrI-like domain-containing protein [Brevibacterium spongiae]
MEKIDLKKSLPSFRARQGRFDTIEVPSLQYLMIDGHGDPNTSPDFSSAVASLYPLAYGLKFLSKLELGRDYVVPPLEGLWWADDMSAFTSARDKSAWDFTLMLLAPHWLDRGHVDDAVDKVRSKGSSPRLGEIRFESLREGTCVQTLHIGPFDDEAEVLEHMHSEVIPAAGMVMTGRHHEIYLSDMRRTAPERLRTILRQPVAPASASA